MIRAVADRSHVVIPLQILEAMVAHSRFTFPEEACGLLAADRTGQLRMVYCLTNVEHSASAYTIAPDEHFGALRHAESRGWSLTGAFHSHPSTPAFPSATDVRLAADPEWIYLIVGLSESPEVRGFLLREGTIDEVLLSIA